MRTVEEHQIYQTDMFLGSCELCYIILFKILRDKMDTNVFVAFLYAIPMKIKYLNMFKLMLFSKANPDLTLDFTQKRNSAD